MKKILSAVLCVMFVSAAAFAQASGNKSSSTAAKPAAKSAAAAKTPAQEPNGGQMAIGYYSGFGAAAPGIGGLDLLAFRFGIDDLISVEGLLGFNLGEAQNSFGFGGKALYNFQKYSNFNAYAFAGMALCIISPKGIDSTNVFGINAGLGVEYFLAPKLSVSSELGLGGSFVKDNNSFGTSGEWMSTLGFRYYFL